LTGCPVVYEDCLNCKSRCTWDIKKGRCLDGADPSYVPPTISEPTPSPITVPTPPTPIPEPDPNPKPCEKDADCEENKVCSNSKICEDVDDDSCDYLPLYVLGVHSWVVNSKLIKSSHAK
jgi:hypothetical protein